jgi:cell division protein FtsL
MGGGAPLAFLNKKTWHPASFRNQEEVWKRQQAAEAEARKAEELRKQIEDERKRDEMGQIAESAGIK